MWTVAHDGMSAGLVVNAGRGCATSITGVALAWSWQTGGGQRLSGDDLSFQDDDDNSSGFTSGRWTKEKKALREDRLCLDSRTTD